MRIVCLNFSFGPSKPKTVYLGHTQVSNQLSIVFLGMSIKLTISKIFENVDVN